MTVVVLVIGALAVVAIALVAVGAAVGRLGPEPARQVFEHDEELDFVVAALPDHVTAELSFDDVQRILRLHLDFLHRKGVARSGGDLPEGEGPIVLDVADAVGYVLQRGKLRKFTPEPEHVEAVIAAQLAYFEAIGAMAEVEGPDLTSGPTGSPLPGPEPGRERDAGPA
ncbi:MAG: hypothetical protein AB7W59_30060 [Acidimicrobiia bacterium]